MIDTDDVTAHTYEDPAALADYQAHLDEIARERVAAVVTDSLARSMFGDLTFEGGHRVGEEVLAGLGCDLTRQHALDLIADGRLIITLADPS